jgi:uncharacterized protein
MMSRSVGKVWAAAQVVSILVICCCVLVCEAQGSKLSEAISSTPRGDAAGMISPSARPGFLGIAGAPHVSGTHAVLWGIWVGWLFSSLGAFGGIMAGIGHITIFGLGDYAKSFNQTNPIMSKLLTDSIRTSNQFLVGLSALTASLIYYRMERLVLAFALFLAVGGVVGGCAAPLFTAGMVDPDLYMGYFGLSVLFLGGVLFCSTTRRGRERNKAAVAAAKAFEKSHIKRVRDGVVDPGIHGVIVKRWGLARIVFAFYGVEFSFNPLIVTLGGAAIAAFSSFIGIGGGFLYVPFLASMAGFPMFLVAGTSALAVLVSMVASIFSFVFVMGVPIDLTFIGLELIGIFIGSLIGPWTSKYTPDIWLARIFVILAFCVGLGYTIKGFAGYFAGGGM